MVNEVIWRIRKTMTELTTHHTKKKWRKQKFCYIKLVDSDRTTSWTQFGCRKAIHQFDTRGCLIFPEQRTHKLHQRKQSFGRVRVVRVLQSDVLRHKCTIFTWLVRHVMAIRGPSQSTRQFVPHMCVCVWWMLLKTQKKFAAIRSDQLYLFISKYRNYECGLWLVDYLCDDYDRRMRLKEVAQDQSGSNVRKNWVLFC